MRASLALPDGIHRVEAVCDPPDACDVWSRPTVYYYVHAGADPLVLDEAEYGRLRHRKVWTTVRSSKFLCNPPPAPHLIKLRLVGAGNGT